MRSRMTAREVAAALTRRLGRPVTVHEVRRAWDADPERLAALRIELMYPARAVRELEAVMGRRPPTPGGPLL